MVSKWLLLMLFLNLPKQTNYKSSDQTQFISMEVNHGKELWHRVHLWWVGPVEQLQTVLRVLTYHGMESKMKKAITLAICYVAPSKNHPLKVCGMVCSQLWDWSTEWMLYMFAWMNCVNCEKATSLYVYKYPSSPNSDCGVAVFPIVQSALSNIFDKIQIQTNRLQL